MSKRKPKIVCTFGPSMDVSAIFEICNDPRISIVESQKLIGDIIREMGGHRPTRIFKIDPETGDKIEIDPNNCGPSKYQLKQMRKNEES